MEHSVASFVVGDIGEGPEVLPEPFGAFFVIQVIKRAPGLLTDDYFVLIDKAVLAVSEQKYGEYRMIAAS